MPLVEVTMIEGRPWEARRAMMREIAEAVSSRCDVPLSTVRVLIREVPAHHWSVGGIPKEELSGGDEENGRGSHRHDRSG